MPPTQSCAAKDGAALTAKESALLTAVMKYAVADPIVNWDGVVADVGYSNERSAREMYRVLKKKLGLVKITPKDSPSPNGISKSNSKTSTPKKAKPKTIISTDPESPLKRRVLELGTPKSDSQTQLKDKIQEVLERSEEDEVPVPARVKREEQDAELGVFGLPEDLV